MFTLEDTVSEDIRAEFLQEEHPLLTLEEARTLIGKKIRWTFVLKPNSTDRQEVYEGTIGEIITEYDLAASCAWDREHTVAQHAEETCPESVQEMKETFLLLDEDRTYMGIRAYVPECPRPHYPIMCFDYNECYVRFGVVKPADDIEDYD